MQIEEKRKIQAFVPVSIYNQIESFGFKSQNEAVNFAFVKLLEHQGNNQDESKNNQNNSEMNQNESNMINQLQTKLEEKENLLKGLQDHNETLKKELDKAERDKEDLKNTYNNYFLQVQTLINQKAIEAPGAKKPWWQFW
jgi:Arc/MetJ-type ribon-helix-helix transcriptional regulator